MRYENEKLGVLEFIEKNFTPIFLGWITGSLIAALSFRFSPSLLISLIFTIILIVVRLNNTRRGRYYG